MTKPEIRIKSELNNEVRDAPRINLRKVGVICGRFFSREVQQHGRRFPAASIGRKSFTLKRIEVLVIYLALMIGMH